MVELLGYSAHNKKAWFIRLFTRKKYDHVAFKINSTQIIDARPCNGFNSYNSHQPKNALVDVFSLNLNSVDMADLERVIATHLGQHPYDFVGIGGYVFGKIFDKRIRHNRKNWFCSEAIVECIRRAGCVIFPGYNACDISPGKLLQDKMFRKTASKILVDGRLF